MLVVLNLTIYSSNESFLNPSSIEDHFGNILYGIIVPVLFCILTFIGVVGNSLSICIICTDHKQRTITNMLLLNLAFADLAFVLICPPFTAYQFATMAWPFSSALGNVLCKLMHLSADHCHSLHDYNTYHCHSKIQNQSRHLIPHICSLDFDAVHQLPYSYGVWSADEPIWIP